MGIGPADPGKGGPNVMTKKFAFFTTANGIFMCIEQGATARAALDALADKDFGDLGDLAEWYAYEVREDEAGSLMHWWEDGASAGDFPIDRPAIFID